METKCSNVLGRLKFEENGSLTMDERPFFIRGREKEKQRNKNGLAMAEWADYWKEEILFLCKGYRSKSVAGNTLVGMVCVIFLEKEGSQVKIGKRGKMYTY